MLYWATLAINCFDSSSIPVVLNSPLILFNFCWPSDILTKSSYAIPVAFEISLKSRLAFGKTLNSFVFSSKYVNFSVIFTTWFCNSAVSSDAKYINLNGSAKSPAATPNLWNVDTISTAPSGLNTLSANPKISFILIRSPAACADILANPATPFSKPYLFILLKLSLTSPNTALVLTPTFLAISTDCWILSLIFPVWIPASWNPFTILPISLELIPTTLPAAYNSPTVSPRVITLVFKLSAIPFCIFVTSVNEPPNPVTNGVATANSTFKLLMAICVWPKVPASVALKSENSFSKNFVLDNQLS